MKFPLVIVTALLFCAFSWRAVECTAQEDGPPQLTQEQIQILQQVVAQMTPEQREALKELPPEQQQAVLMQLLERVLPKKPEGIKEFIGADARPTINFMKRDRYIDTAERIEEFIYNESKRHVKITEIGFVREGHDHFFTYKRMYRAKYKTKKSEKEYVADFILEKEGAYMKVVDWRRVEQADS